VALCQSLACALPSIEASGGGTAVAEHPEEQKEPRTVAQITTEIVVAFITRNTITPDDLGDLIVGVSRALDALAREEPEPAVDTGVIFPRSAV
jgi:predicted transcriptional regulator